MCIEFAKVVIVVAVVTMAISGACTAPEGPRTVDSRYLSQKVPAIKEAAERRDASVAPKLVEDLDSDDAAVRFYAIEGLERLSGGETFGYVYYDDDRERRREAVLKWRQWLNDQHP